VSLVLKAEGLWKSYGQKAVLKGITYTFSPNRIYALMGPNGSGKSTLLRILSLLDPADEGRVIYTDGASTPLEHDIALRRRITLLLPDIGLFNASVLSNASYGLRVRGVKGKEAKKRALKALSLVGLEQKHRQNALTLSSGEAQRLALARALAVEPDVLFLDEPTASVDAENTGVIEKIILEMKGRRSIILSTHDEAQARRLADVVLYLKDGLIYEG
jgi:tungstate transport system ATP-binding protein